MPVCSLSIVSRGLQYFDSILVALISPQSLFISRACLFNEPDRMVDSAFNYDFDDADDNALLLSRCHLLIHTYCMFDILLVDTTSISLNTETAYIK